MEGFRGGGGGRGRRQTAANVEMYSYDNPREWNSAGKTWQLQDRQRKTVETKKYD